MEQKGAMGNHFTNKHQRELFSEDIKIEAKIIHKVSNQSTLKSAESFFINKYKPKINYMLSS